MKPRIRERKLGRERADGLYHPTKRLAEIDPRQVGLHRLDTLMHELTHHFFPYLSEEEITEKIPQFAKALWVSRVRIIDSDK